MVVQEIKNLMNYGGGGGYFVYDGSMNDYRPLEYRDIVILMRSTEASAHVFHDILSSSGIPVYSDSGSGYFDTVEVQTIISMLRIIDNPYQDIHVLSVLRSPVFSFTSEEIIISTFRL
jgi:ATP-dependent helicase/nuclease subunit A